MIRLLPLLPRLGFSLRRRSSAKYAVKQPTVDPVFRAEIKQRKPKDPLAGTVRLDPCTGSLSCVLLTHDIGGRSVRVQEQERAQGSDGS